MNILVIHPNLVGLNLIQNNGMTFIKNISIKQGYRYAESHNWDVVIVDVPETMLDKNWKMCLETHSKHIVYMQV